MKDQPQTRLQDKQTAGLDLGLPVLGPGEYMPTIMRDIGPTRLKGYDAQGQSIMEATDWPVIAPFGEATGLDADDMVILSKMCRAYYEETLRGVDHFTIEPVDRDWAVSVLQELDVEGEE